MIEFKCGCQLGDLVAPFAEEQAGRDQAALAAWKKAVFYYPDDKTLTDSAAAFAGKHSNAALAQALARLLGDETLRANLGRRGGEIVRRKYQFAVFQSELERILVECETGFCETRMARRIL